MGSSGGGISLSRSHDKFDSPVQHQLFIFISIPLLSRAASQSSLLSLPISLLCEIILPAVPSIVRIHFSTTAIMKFDTSIILATLAASTIAAPAAHPHAVQRSAGIQKLPANLAASVRQIVKEKAKNKRQLDQLLGGLTGGAGGAGGQAGGGAGGLSQLLGGSGGGNAAGAADGAAGQAGGAGGPAGLLGGLGGGNAGADAAVSSGQGLDGFEMLI